MSKLSLKNIIGKKNEASSLLLSLMQQTLSPVRIEDTDGKLLLGNSGLSNDYSYPIKVDDELLGYVKGDEKGMIIAAILSHLSQKEAEKKKLGNEVLNLYQEINVIFNFSEKLAETIEPEAIARVTLDQAMHSIAAHSGVLVLWDDEKKELQVPAFFGESLFNEDKLKSNPGLLLKIGLSGQSEIINDLTLLKEKEIIANEVHSLLYASMKVKHRIMGALILAGFEAEQFSAANLKLLVTLALQSSAAIESAMLYEKNIREAREKEEAMRRIYEVTGKFVPHEFIRSLGHKVITDVKLGDNAQKIVTVLFSDIRGYTTLSEQMTPEENFAFVCSFNEQIGPIIRKHNGFVNQYLGDSIMAIFTGNAADALAAAVEMQKEVQEFNKLRQQQDQSPIQIGIGMHTGSLIMGLTGDKNRMDACTISDTVNTASRIESLTKHYKANIILSEASLEQIQQKENFHLRNLGSVQLKGKHKSIKIHECFSDHLKSDLQKKSDTLILFNGAVFHYLAGSFNLANIAFEQVLTENPGDRTAKFFFNHTKQIIETGVPQNWDGVMEMMEK